jgi:hypothetical protein
MAILFMDGFEHYGLETTGRNNMLDNVYSEAGSGIGQVEPSSAQARTGDASLFFKALNGQELRRVLPTAVDEVFVGFALYAPQLPAGPERISICQLRNSSNSSLLTISILPTGALAVRNGSVLDPIVAVTSGPVIGAASWNHIEVRAVRGSGTVQIRVNGEEVLNTSALTFTDPFAIYAVSGRGGGGNDIEYFIDDLIVNDTSGSYNNTWKGDLRVATLFPDADGTPSGWARVGRDKFGAGVFFPDQGCLYVDDQPGFEIGSGDFTVEGFFKIYDEPASGAQTIAGQWDEDNDERSWRLWRDFDSSGALKFSISTDGTIGTITDIVNWTGWTPLLNRWYFISISRVSGTTYLHVDGQLQGAGRSDSNTYHNSTSPLWLGQELDGTGPGARNDVDSSFYADAFRFTVGTGRYNSANYTPPTAEFPTSAPSDPDFADVELLFAFNNVPDPLDLSSNGYTVDLTLFSPENPRVIDVQADTAGKYAVVDDKTPSDRTFIAADFIFATGELTLTANPSNTETVTIGSITYTFVNSLSSANDVLIGADANESLENLAAAVNGAAGEGTTYGTGTTANTDASAAFLGASQLRATAGAQGTAGNSVTTTETLANGSWTGSTLSGGADIPAAQEFEFSPLPIDTTQVRGIQLYHRSAKSDSGACNLQTSFHVGASSTDGADRPITTAFSYWTDVFEEDPDTGAGLTVNSLVAGAFQIDRTA